MNQSEINEAEWADPSNWRFGCYSSPRDTRVWVRKPITWTGWTLNFAHRAAWLWLAAILAPAIATTVLVLLTSGAA